MKIVFVGAGNLATRLSLAMQRVGMQMGQVYSHTEESARQLAAQLGCPWTNDLSALQADADLYVFSLKDTALQEVISVAEELQIPLHVFLKDMPDGSGCFILCRRSVRGGM